MRVQTVLLLLASNAFAAPYLAPRTANQRGSVSRRQKTQLTDTTSISKTADLCDQDFKPKGVSDDLKDDYTEYKWKAIGADDYLREDLMKDGAKGWSRRLFLESEVGGGPKTTSYDCTRLDQHLCGPTAACNDYEPKAAYFVHAAMVNYFSFFAEMREALQDIGVWQLSGGIKSIKDTFGSPPSDMGGLFPVLIGLFVAGATAAGSFPNPSLPAVAALNAGVSLLNIAAGMYEYDKAEPELEDDMEKTLGNIFVSFVGSVETAVEMFFSGDFSDSDKDIDAKDYIADTFSDGSLVEDLPVNKAIDEWKKSVRDMINTVLIIEALKDSKDYRLQRVSDIDEDECKEKNGLHFDGTCNRIGYFVEGDGPMDLSLNHDTSGTLRGMPDDKFKAMTEDFGLDYKALLQNAIDCDGKKPSLEDWASFDKKDSLPKCLVSLKVEKPDRSKCDYTSCADFSE